MSFDWSQNAIPILHLTSTIILVIITGIYVYFTKKIVDTAVRQSNLSFNPVIGIKLGKMKLSKVWFKDRRSLNIGIDLVNVGNAPAIDILVDGEIVLNYSDVNGEKNIPARIEPRVIVFLCRYIAEISS